MIQCYQHLDNGEAALPYTQRMPELVEGEYGVSSKEYAKTLGTHFMIYTQIQEFPAAYVAMTKALTILEDLGLQHDELYCALRAAEGEIHYGKCRYEEALVSYNKAKVLFADNRNGTTYGILLNSIGLCHVQLNQWKEVIACYKESVDVGYEAYGKDHPE